MVALTKLTSLGIAKLKLKIERKFNFNFKLKPLKKYKVYEKSMKKLKSLNSNYAEEYINSAINIYQILIFL